MMDKILIIGSGASGVHFALSVLQKGYEVLLCDVGHAKPDDVNPEDNVNDLKTNLSDPVQYFLGQRYEAVVYPGSEREYYGFPPNKSYIFSKPSTFTFEARGFEPLFSFAQGGVAEAWTGGVYPLNDYELQDFPFRYTDIEPYYSEVAKRIGIAGVKDDLARFYPIHENLMEPLRLDQLSHRLLAAYEKHKGYLNKRLTCYLGRSRVATLSKDKGERKECAYLGRCLWGCPVEALYTPSITLKECLKYPNFRYVPNMYVSHFKYNSAHRIVSVVAESLIENTSHEITADKFILAAGALSSSRIFLDSLFKATGEIATLPGLMDNRQILVPFISLKMMGETYSPDSYQYHQIAVGIESAKPEEYVHGQITTLKSALVHPIIQKIPLDLRASIFLFRNLRAGLGIVNVNLHDRRRENSYITLQPEQQPGRSKLVIHYSPAINEKRVIKQAVRKVVRCLWKLGCVVPPGMIHVRPMGASVHYAGTLPMSTERKPYTSSKYCQSHDFDNLYIVDGTTFPFLPAKNLTFTLMANAIRVADHV